MGNQELGIEVYFLTWFQSEETVVDPVLKVGGQVEVCRVVGGGSLGSL
jgi:hypothetical protein